MQIVVLSCTEKTMKLHAVAKANSMGGRKWEFKVKLFGVKNGKATNTDCQLRSPLLQLSAVLKI